MLNILETHLSEKNQNNLTRLEDNEDIISVTANDQDMNVLYNHDIFFEDLDCRHALSIKNLSTNTPQQYLKNGNLIKPHLLLKN